MLKYSDQDRDRGQHTLDTPVLDFGPRPGEQPSRGASLWLAWPAWEWKIVGPKPNRRSLNLFERVVLRLGQAGVRDPEAQGRLLGLSHELIALIHTQGQSGGWLDARGAPTKRGERLLEDDAALEQDVSLVTGLVYQDPDSQQLWPRFVEQRSLAEVDYRNEKGRPTLLRGTSGNPRREQLFVVQPEDPDPPCEPELARILDALVRSHQASRRTASASSGPFELDPDWNDSVSDHLSKYRLERIKVLEPVPEPVYLLTRVYLPSAEVEEAGWRVCDCFGLGDNLLLRQRVEAKMRLFPPLEQRVQNLVKAETSESLSLSGWQQRLEQQALEELKKQLSLDITSPRHRHLLPRLMEFEAAWKEAVAMGQKCSEAKRKAVLIAGQNVIEFLLRRFWTDAGGAAYSAPLVKSLVNHPGDRQYNARAWNDVAKSLGFLCPLPDSLSRVRAGKVIQALEHGRGTLRPMLLAALMHAGQAENHALRRAASAHPELLRSLDALAGARDEAAHDSPNPPLLEAVEAHRKQVYITLKVLLGL